MCAHVSWHERGVSPVTPSREPEARRRGRGGRWPTGPSSCEQLCPPRAASTSRFSDYAVGMIFSLWEALLNRLEWGRQVAAHARAPPCQVIPRRPQDDESFCPRAPRAPGLRMRPTRRRRAFVTPATWPCVAPRRGFVAPATWPRVAPHRGSVTPATWPRVAPRRGHCASSPSDLSLRSLAVFVSVAFLFVTSVRF